MGKCKIGQAQSFWGDRDGAAAELLRTQPDLDFITFDYLAEVSLSIMAAQRQKDETKGYAADFISAVKLLLPQWETGVTARLITNAGGLNPIALAKELQKLGIADKKIAVVTGDDVLAHFSNRGFYTANAYLGATAIKEALDEGADIVITGRVADPSLTVAAAAHYHQWSWDALDSLAGATLAGHLIECGPQVTGGISTNWLDTPDPAHIGYPIAEVAENGSCVITKAPESGGRVSIETVKEQLLYELGDPELFLTPDVTVSLRNVSVKEIAPNRIEVKGALGKPPPATLKVSATRREGYRSEATLVIVGDRLKEKAERTRSVIFTRLADQGWSFEHQLMELFGPTDNRILMRLAVSHDDSNAVEAFAKEIAPLVSAGAQGTTGYTGGRPKVRPMFGFYPEFIDRNSIVSRVSYYEAVRS